MEKALRSLQFTVKVWRPKRQGVSMGMGGGKIHFGDCEKKLEVWELRYSKGIKEC